MTQEHEPSIAAQRQALDIDQMNRRLDMLDQRLDSIDSMVTAVAERVMKQPVTLSIICPRCGRNIEITLIGSEKPTG